MMFWRYDSSIINSRYIGFSGIKNVVIRVSSPIFYQISHSKLSGVTLKTSI